MIKVSSILFLLLFCFDTFAKDNGMQIIVSIRYLQLKGRSYHHLYLYNEQGKLIRQLTNEKADDLEPKFSRDGSQVEFERIANEGSKIYSLSVSDGSLKQREHRDSYAYEYEKDEFHLMSSFANWENWGAEEKGQTNIRYFPAPDDSADLMIKFPQKPDYIDNVEGFLRDRKTKVITPISSFIGFQSFGSLMVSNKSPFLFQPPLRVFFFRIHQGSTDGGSYWAVDLNQKKITQLTKNGGDIIPLIGKPGFFCINQERYQPLGDGRTVNCSYLDWWDSNLKRTRFSNNLGRLGGASILHNKDDYPLQIPDFEGRSWIE